MPRPKRPASQLNISRTTDDRRWLVCIKRNGVVMHQTFHDNLLGGKRASLQAAKVWRDAVLIRHPLLPRQTRMQSVTAKNNRSKEIAVPFAGIRGSRQ